MLHQVENGLIVIIITCTNYIGELYGEGNKLGHVNALDTVARSTGYYHHK